MDSTDTRIVQLLQADGKTSFQEIATAVHLSSPAAFQRVRKLEASGVILGYHARVDPSALGRGVLAFVQVMPPAGADLAALRRRWRRTASVLECHRVSGLDRFMLKLRLATVAELSAFADALRRVGCGVHTELALETEFERWTL
ncbi:MAG TPA: Lrp/AsnC family transcriptional regulator [Gemmatimonadales bacterium]